MGFLNEYYGLYQKLDAILKKYSDLKQQNQEYKALCLTKDYEKVLEKIYAFNQKAREKQPIFEKHLSLSQEERVLEFAITSRIEIQHNPLHEKLNKDIFTFVYLQELPLKKALYSDNLEDFSYIKQYILRLLQLSPLNALHFTLIDPKTLGDKHPIYAELDIAFSDGKNLYVVECKSGELKNKGVLTALSTNTQIFGGANAKCILISSDDNLGQGLQEKVKILNIKFISKDFKKNIENYINASRR
ncbi:hypothetical protein HGK51_04800 [Helicobacter pylori]|uniref:DUF1887 family protein n=1 Tax=Helicobacter pylori TaxID=210 RepID=A0ABD7CCN4_HELPX|nr:hypothetical protein [Helicobacter pylori]QQW99648.1 hypothetical protein HGK51_04800 [Helicobacter pylori]